MNIFKNSKYGLGFFLRFVGQRLRVADWRLFLCEIENKSMPSTARPHTFCTFIVADCPPTGIPTPPAYCNQMPAKIIFPVGWVKKNTSPSME